MQKPWAINDFIIDDRSGLGSLGRANCTIKSALDGGIGLPGAGARLARRYGFWPIITGLERPGSRQNLTTYFSCSDKATQRRNLLAELNPELEIAARLYAADYLAPEGLIAAFGPWDVYPDDDAAWHCKSLLWSRAGDGELSARLDADITGPVNFRDGPNDRQRAIVVEEVATTLIINPSFETDTADWTTDGTNVIARTNENGGKFGTYALKSTYGDSAALARTFSNSITVPGAGDYYISAWIWVPKTFDGNNILLVSSGFVGSSDTLVTSWTSSDARGEWFLLETVVAVVGGDLIGGVHVQINNAPTADKFIYTDAVNFVAGDYRTTYIDGSLGPGYSWSGAAHGSTSTRAVGEFELDNYTNIISEKATRTFRILARMPYDADGDWPDTTNWLMDALDVADRIIVRYRADSDRFAVWIDDADYLLSAAQTFSAGDWIDITVTIDFDNDSYALYLNGALSDTDTTSLEPQSATAWSLGSSVTATTHGNFWIAEFDVWDRVLNANEIAQMATNGAAHLRARYLNVLCEASQPLVIDGAPSPRGTVSTLAIDGDVRWRSRDGDVHFWSTYDDAWDQTVSPDSDDDAWPIIRITPDLAKDAGTGFQYKSPVLVEWKAPSSAANYPVVMVLDTSALNGAGKVQADLDDLRVYVDGLEVDRWLSSTTPSATTEIWINLDFSAHLEFGLKTAIAGGGAITEIELDDSEDITTLPASGLVLIDSEVFVYTGKNNFSRKLTGVTRAMRGTAAAAHTTADVVKWIQFDVMIVYGDSSLSAPVTNDDFKPVFNLATSTNDSWVYASFGETDKPRAAAWVSEIAQDPRPFVDSQSDFDIPFSPSPWTTLEIDNLMYLGDGTGGMDGPAATGKVGEARWKVQNVCGITNSNFTNIVGGGTGNVPDTTTQMQSSENGTLWETVIEIATGASNQALDAGGADKWVAMYSFCTVAYGDSSGTSNSADIEVGDVTLTLYNTLTPDTTIQSEETAYQISATLTNSTTNKALLIDFISDLDETLEIDTYNGQVKYLLDNTKQQQAVRQEGGAKREWLPLANGDNSLEWSDAGTNDLDLQFFWERRYWE